MSNNQKAKIRENEELWINYLEGELEPSLKQDLDIQLNHSTEAQELVSQYKRLKSEIRSLGDAPAFSQEYHDKLHDKVMDKISHKSIQSPIFSLHHQKNKLLVMAASFLLVLGSIFAWNLHQSGNLLNNQEDVAVSPIGEWMLEKKDDDSKLLKEEKEQADEEKSLQDKDSLN